MTDAHDLLTFRDREESLRNHHAVRLITLSECSAMGLDLHLASGREYERFPDAAGKPANLAPRVPSEPRHESVRTEMSTN
jgi:hypothetical protein